MPKKKAEIKGNIAKYFIKREEGERAREGTTTTDPSRMFQLNRMEGTGQGEAGPTHDKTHNTIHHDKGRVPHGTTEEKQGPDKKGRTTNDLDAHDYGGTEGDRKGKRDARLGPQKSKSPQKAAPSDDEVTWGTPSFPRSKEEAKLERGSGVASKHVPEEDGAASMGASWRAARSEGVV